MLTALLGLLFDGVWHTVNRFDTFWTPPHIMIYSGFGVGGTLLLYAIFHPWFRTREVFGPALRVPFLAVPVPASAPSQSRTRTRSIAMPGRWLTNGERCGQFPMNKRAFDWIGGVVATVGALLLPPFYT